MDPAALITHISASSCSIPGIPACAAVSDAGPLMCCTAGALMSGADSVKQLFVPEDTSKVAHGDANLCIEDFFAKF